MAESALDRYDRFKAQGWPVAELVDDLAAELRVASQRLAEVSSAYLAEKRKDDPLHHLRYPRPEVPAWALNNAPPSKKKAEEAQ